VPNQQATTPSQPCERPLDNPATSVAPQLATVLVRRVRVVLLRRDDRFDPALCQPRAQSVAVIAAVQHQSIRLRARPTRSMRATYLDGGDRLLEELRLARTGRVQVCSQRSTRAIDQKHPLGSLALLGRSDSGAPFFAGAKLPSPKHSSQRTFSASFKSARKPRHSASSVPSSSHCRSRRQHVLELPYVRGNALHGAPVHRIHRIPSKHLRGSAGGRPPRGLLLRRGSCGAIRAHCASLNRPLNAMVHLRVSDHGFSLPRVAGF
jgi:hypothetical protein